MKELRKRLFRIIAAGMIFITAAVSGQLWANYASWLRYMPAILAVGAYILAGADVLYRAVRNIARGRIFDENFLMALATVGAIALGEYLEAAAVMVFYQVGELFQSYSVAQSRKSIAQLMDIRPDYANIKRDNELVQVDPYDVSVGDVIVIKPGERIPLDSVVITGKSTVDTTALTGESVPRTVECGDSLLSGCVNIGGVLEAKVLKAFGESTVSRILELVENASSKKSVSETFISKFARYYTPAVVIAATALAIIPPIVTHEPFSVWISRALIFLVVSCPCALVISIPLSFFGGIGGASRRGVLVKGGTYFDSLAHAKTVVFDKTGTLTKGVFDVQQIHAENGEQAELLRLAAHAEAYSTHPIASSVLRAWGNGVDRASVSDVQEIPGGGVSADVDGIAVLAGNARLMESHGIAFARASGGTIVHVAANGVYLGYLLISDALKSDAAAAVAGLKAAGVSNTVMLTGDSDEIGKSVAKQLGIDSVYTELLPDGKVEHVEKLLEQKPAKSTLVFVGDGINDAPVLARADIGIAMGGLGSDAAIEAADIVIMTDEPSKVALAVKIARRTLGIANANIVFALGVKALVLLLAAIGKSDMWQAIFADVGVSVIAIVNSLRALNTEKL